MQSNDNPRVEYVKNLAEALGHISQDYSVNLPVYLRAIMVSTGEPLTLLGSFEQKKIVRNISDILKNGTELNFNDQGNFLNSKVGLNQFLVQLYDGQNYMGSQLEKAIMINSVDIDIQQPENTSFRHAVLMYDPKITQIADPVKGTSICRATLPDLQEARETAILKSYIFSED